MVPRVAAILTVVVACRSLPVHGSIINGDFSDGLTGWQTSGPVSVIGGAGDEVAFLDEDELLLDGSARLNLATFVTTWMEPQAEKLMAECFAKNMIDKDEYPQTAEIEHQVGALPVDRRVVLMSEHFQARLAGASERFSDRGLVRGGSWADPWPSPPRTARRQSSAIRVPRWGGW